MRRAVLLCLSLVFAALAHAGTATLDWTPPTTNTDGTAIPTTGPASLAGYKVYYGTSATALTQTLSVTAPPVTVQSLTPATWYFAVTAYNVAGAESDKSAIASKVILEPPPPVPNPPGGLVVTASTAYTLVKGKDRFVLLPVGTVPANTPCNPDQTVNGYYVVPKSAVTWSGTVRPDVVVAKCT